MLLKFRLMPTHLFLSSSTRQWRRHKLTMMLGAYFALQTTPATADTILLINGDKISGTLIKKETEHLVIKTSYAGELQVQWAEIKNIEADKSMQLVFKDGTKFWGRFMPDAHGNVKIIGDHNHLALHRTLSDVQYVNPSKEVLGEELIWTGNFNAGATFNQGNSDNRNAQINGQSILRNKQHRYTLQGYAYWAQQGGQDIQNNTRIKGQYDRFFDKKWYGYLNTTFENDRFRDIRLSTNLGAGTGYQIYEGKKRNLSIEGGLTWVDLRYYSAPEASYPAARWAVNYDQYLFDSFVQLFHREELLYMPSTPSQMILHSQSGLRFPFILGFNATTQVDYNYNSRPVNHRYKADTRALFTLGYTWK